MHFLVTVLQTLSMKQGNVIKNTNIETDLARRRKKTEVKATSLNVVNIKPKR
nr:hypothetical protein Iba_chr14bCG14020 [Ipomoea batatas]